MLCTIFLPLLYRPYYLPFFIVLFVWPLLSSFFCLFPYCSWLLRVIANPLLALLLFVPFLSFVSCQFLCPACSTSSWCILKIFLRSSSPACTERQAISLSSSLSLAKLPCLHCCLWHHDARQWCRRAAQGKGRTLPRWRPMFMLFYWMRGQLVAMAAGWTLWKREEGRSTQW